jgi:hypothetical protein
MCLNPSVLVLERNIKKPKEKQTKTLPKGAEQGKLPLHDPRAAQI